MPPETEAPVVETPVEKPAPTVTPVETTSAEKPRGSRFPKPKPLSEIVRESQAKAEPVKKEPEAKPEPEKPAKPAAEVTPDAPEASKPKKDTEVAPRSEKRSLRETLAQGDAPEETPEVKAPETAEDDDDPTLTDKMRKRVNKLKGETAKERQAREAAEKKAQDLEARIAELDARPKLTEQQIKEQEVKEEELLKLRRRYSLETDPEVKKFDTRIEAAKKTVEATIAKASGIPDFVRTFIKDAGGFEAFLRAGKLYDVKVGDENKKLTGSQIFKHIQSEMDPLDLGAIQTSVGEQNRIAAEKAAFIEEESGKAKEWFESQAQAQQEAVQRQESAQKSQQAMFTAIGQTITSEKWMQDEQPEAGADPETIKAIRSRNALRAQLRDLVTETINFKPTSQDPEKAQREVGKFYEGIIRDSAKLYYVDAELKAARAQIKRLEADLDAIKGASRTTPRNGGGTATPPSTNSKAPARNAGESDFAYGMRMVQAGVPEADRQAALLKR